VQDGEDYFNDDIEDDGQHLEEELDGEEDEGDLNGAETD
jgi:hypothetical protein